MDINGAGVLGAAAGGGLFDAYGVGSRALAVRDAAAASVGRDVLEADRPGAGVAHHFASWLGAARRSTRTAGIRCPAVRPGHRDVGFADRSVADTAQRRAR
ncbi:hypothetical protein [Streptomyces canus]|uniref:hypothetical protein n=1 Tax=Streptomyces canus TaxID=58343 RepID=UPI0022589781|nr:hypothetical protein [Streptomyces canus]MCX4854204.1 hypothetical protein [Streptomyces canus]